MTTDLSSKPSAALATALTRKWRKRYDEDPFFRSTVNVVLVQTLFTFVTVLIFVASLLAIKNETEELIADYREQYAQGIRFEEGALESDLFSIALQSFGMVLVILLIAAITFAALTARYALEPTRSTLAVQKRFIGNLAHELRTPLSVIRTSTEVALMDPKDKQLTTQTLTDTLEELDRVSQIINNLLSFQGLLKTGALTFVPVDVAKIAKHTIARHGEFATTRGVNLEYTGPDAALIDGNAVALEQAITNVVKNAVTYTPSSEGRSVRVTIDDQPDKIVVLIADEGIGIAHKDLHYVFEPFYRGDTARDRRVGSGTSGLGLAIVNDIVRAHKGSIVIRSALNRGTAIEMTFLRSVATPSEELPDDDQEHEARIA